MDSDDVVTSRHAAEAWRPRGRFDFGLLAGVNANSAVLLEVKRTRKVMK